VGGKAGQALGEHFGDAELGKRIGEVSGGLLGGVKDFSFYMAGLAAGLIFIMGLIGMRR